MKSIAIFGCGNLADIIVTALLDGLLSDYKLIGAYSRTKDKSVKIAERVKFTKHGYGCVSCDSIDEFVSLKPDYVIEAASPSAMRDLALPVLRSGSSIVTLSIGAFSDKEFYNEVESTAREHGVKVHIVAGATGGFDVLRTASLIGPCEVSFRTEKNPNPLRGSAVYDEMLQSEERKVFEGNAVEAISLFPTQVNVAVAASLASVGPENINVSINSIPDYVGDDHRIELKSEQVHAVIDVYSKTAQIAGWSVVNTLRNIASPIVF